MSSPLLPIFLGLFSAVTLAIANVAVKRGGDILATRVGMALAAAVIVSPAAFFVPLPDMATWQALGFSLPAHFFYQGCMIRALHRGELSLVFPVMRGTAPLLTGLFAWLILGEALSPIAIFGLILATSAVMFFGMPSGGSSFRRHPDASALFWAGGTALGIALYSVADGHGVRTAPTPFTYIVWLFLLAPVMITITAIVTRRGALIEAGRATLRPGLLAGGVSVLSFGAALYAISLMEVARVSALRETAVVFAALLAWLFLKEGFGLRRTVAAAVLATGLVLLQLSG